MVDLELTAFQTTRQWLQQVSLTSARVPKKTCTWSAVNFRKTRDLDELLTWEPASDHNMDVKNQRSP